MPRPSRTLILPVLFLLLAGPSTALDLEPCRLTDSAGRNGVAAECGHLPVPVDRSNPDGEQIDLFVARVPALVGGEAPSAFTVIQGGPGGSSVDLYLALRGAFEGVRRTRDVLLVDQRGTGRSAPLRCDELDGMEEFTLGEQFDPERIPELVEACLAALPHDPRFFTTSVAVRDLEAVRTALGYGPLDVYGVSYGTRVALHYARRHPQAVRTLVLDGVAPPDWVLGPDIAPFAQDALDAVFARCAADPDCAARFDDPAADLERLRTRLVDDAEPLTLRDPVSGEPTELRFGLDALRIALRLLSYQPETQALVPMLLARAADGDPGPLAAQALLLGSDLEAALAVGMHNAVVCTEDAPRMAAAIDETALDAAYLGRSQIESLQAMCEVWPAGVLDADFAEPVRSDVPTLLLSGENDPVTPPANADRAAVHLADARAIVAPGMGHGVVMRGCLPRLLAEFVETADPSALQTGCIGTLTPLPFFLAPTGPAP